MVGRFPEGGTALRTVWLVVVLVVSAGCDNQDVRQRRYMEVSVQPVPSPQNETMALPAPPVLTGRVSGTQATVRWQIPEGWEEKPSSGMRLATFLVQGRECTLTSFPGDVGGVEANLKRWQGQISGVDPGTEALRVFMEQAPSFVSTGDMPCRLYDFRSLVVPSGDDAQSMLAAILERGNSRVFVKLVAPARTLGEERARFESLCRSLQ